MSRQFGGGEFVTIEYTGRASWPTAISGAMPLSVSTEKRSGSFSGAGRMGPSPSSRARVPRGRQATFTTGGRMLPFCCEAPSPTRSYDARGEPCPLPLLRLARELRGIGPGQIVALLADDPAAREDVPL